MRRLCYLLLLFWPLLSFAQPLPEPLAEVEQSSQQAIPGQPITLRLSVLVPTWMPEPPVWPSFETPNVLVQLPERATSPISKTINGETWSGITRRYQITPMIPGEVLLPETEVTVTYASPGSPDPIKARIATPEIQVTGIVPKGAEGLEPFIAASSLSLEQVVDGETEGLQPGDSFARVITATLDGLSPIFLPELTSVSPAPGLRSYPESPVIEETENRGLLSGTRKEKTVYLAEGQTDAVLPGLELRWFNIETNSIETAQVPEIRVTAEGPAKPQSAPTSPWAAVIALLTAAVIFIITALFLRRYFPVLRQRIEQFRNAEFFRRQKVSRALRDAIRAKDLPKTRHLMDIWMLQRPEVALQISDEIKMHLRSAGAAKYGGETHADESTTWKAIDQLVHSRRHKRWLRSPSKTALPPLNPSQTN